MVRLISSDGMKDINYDAFALEVEEDEEGFWLINAYTNLVSADEDVLYYTMSVNDTKEEALEELENIHVMIGRQTRQTITYIKLEDHVNGNSDSWHRQ